MLHEVCKNDYFMVDAGRIRVCSRGDLVCSKLSDIAVKKTDFCPLLGYEVTDNGEPDEWFMQFYKNDDNEEGEIAVAQIQPICWDFTPSAAIFGPSSKPPPSKLPAKDFAKTMKEQINDSSSSIIATTLLYVLATFAFFIFLAVAVYIWIVFQEKRKEEKK